VGSVEAQPAPNGLLVLEPPVFSDERGEFFESYNKLAPENHVSLSPAVEGLGRK
jgi:dTDP-4-dehydrorhamnose 3,5-epimerase-like enzyme